MHHLVRRGSVLLAMLPLLAIFPAAAIALLVDAPRPGLLAVCALALTALVAVRRLAVPRAMACVVLGEPGRRRLVAGWTLDEVLIAVGQAPGSRVVVTRARGGAGTYRIQVGDETYYVCVAERIGGRGRRQRAQLAERLPLPEQLPAHSPEWEATAQAQPNGRGRHRVEARTAAGCGS